MPERANQIERRGNNIPLSTESIWYCRHKQKSIKETPFYWIRHFLATSCYEKSFISPLTHSPLNKGMGFPLCNLCNDLCKLI